VIYWREGYYVHEPITLYGMDTQWTTGEIVRLAKRIHDELGYAPNIDVMIDETGVGAGVVDALNANERDHASRAFINVIPVNFGGPGDEENADTATVLLAGVKEALQYAHLPDDDDTIAQLSTRKYRVRPDGKVKIESKDEMRARKVASPDRADALGLCFYQPRNSVTMSGETHARMKARRARR
jgi:hypothetical protein